MTTVLANEPKFISKSFDQYSYLNWMELYFGWLGKPTGSRPIEVFKGRLR